MRKELITLTKQEHERLEIIGRVMKRELRQKEAGALIGVTDRQIRNLVWKVRASGASGIAHGNRGKPSPKRMPEELVGRIVERIRERYQDFKPKFAAEKLWKKDRIKVSDEKLRQIMIEAGLWRIHRRKGVVHAWRERKAYFGELVQMDGSHHEWLEERGPKLVLMGMVDDARNRFYGRFHEYEGVYPVMNALEGYLRLYGIPRRLYVDKHSTYKTVRFNAQFEREALQPGDLHRPLPKGLKLEEIFCLKTIRTIHNGYFIRHRGRRFAIEEPSRRMQRRPALVLDHFDGRMIIRFEGQDLAYREIEERETPRKPKIMVRPKPPKYMPPPDHPWRRPFITPSPSSPLYRP